VMAIKVTDGPGGITPACGICLITGRNMAPDPRRAEICMIVRAAAPGSRIECGMLAAAAVSLHP
jgi:hypothetical protein